jgi:hypothetical protein
VRHVPIKPIESEGVEAIDTPLYASCPQRILPLHPHGIDISVRPECMASSTLFRGHNTWNPHSKSSRLYGRSQSITIYGQHCILNSVGHLLCNMTALLMSMTEHARTLLLGGVMLWVQQKWCGEMMILGFLKTSINNPLIVKTTIRMTFPADDLELNFLVRVEDEYS